MTAEKQARLFLRGKRHSDGSFPAMTALKRNMISNGFKEADLHVGYAVAKGLFYCKKCGEKVKDPQSDFYQNDEYWKCKCNQINFVKNSSYENE